MGKAGFITRNKSKPFLPTELLVYLQPKKTNNGDGGKIVANASSENE